MSSEMSRERERGESTKEMSRVCFGLIGFSFGNFRPWLAGALLVFGDGGWDDLSYKSWRAWMVKGWECANSTFRTLQGWNSMGLSMQHRLVQTLPDRPCSVKSKCEQGISSCVSPGYEVDEEAVKVEERLVSPSAKACEILGIKLRKHSIVWHYKWTTFVGPGIMRFLTNLTIHDVFFEFGGYWLPFRRNVWPQTILACRMRPSLEQVWERWTLRVTSGSCESDIWRISSGSGGNQKHFLAGNGSYQQVSNMEMVGKGWRWHCD